MFTEMGKGLDESEEKRRGEDGKRVELSKGWMLDTKKKR